MNAPGQDLAGLYEAPGSGPLAGDVQIMVKVPGFPDEEFRAPLSRLPQALHFVAEPLPEAQNGTAHAGTLYGISGWSQGGTVYVWQLDGSWDIVGTLELNGVFSRVSVDVAAGTYGPPDYFIAPPNSRTATLTRYGTTDLGTLTDVLGIDCSGAVPGALVRYFLAAGAPLPEFSFATLPINYYGPFTAGQAYAVSISVSVSDIQVVFGSPRTSP